jgi:hypothetical protein
VPDPAEHDAERRHDDRQRRLLPGSQRTGRPGGRNVGEYRWGENT